MATKGEAVLVFPSTHHMLRAEALLKGEGFPGRLVPAPQKPWPERSGAGRRFPPWSWTCRVMRQESREWEGGK